MQRTCPRSLDTLVCEREMRPVSASSCGYARVLSKVFSTRVSSTCIAMSIACTRKVSVCKTAPRQRSKSAGAQRIKRRCVCVCVCVCVCCRLTISFVDWASENETESFSSGLLLDRQTCSTQMRALSHGSVTAASAQGQQGGRRGPDRCRDALGARCWSGSRRRSCHRVHAPPPAGSPPQSRQ